MKITKRKALEDCVKIWSELAKTGAIYKPEWAIEKYSVNGCPCCRYADDHLSLCSECLLIGLWPDTCCSPGSPYYSWDYTKGEDEANRKKYAKIIANYAKKMLKEMGKKKKKEKKR